MEENKPILCSEDDLTDPDINVKSDQYPSKASLTSVASARMAVNQLLNPSASSPFAQKAATAQAKMKASKYTGRLFCMENMEMLPAPLQPGFMKIVGITDSLEVQIETHRSTIELLIYWENLTNTLVWTLSIIFTFLIAKLGMSFGWILIILAVLGGAFKRNMNRLRRKIRHDIKVASAKKKMDTDKETVEWLNSFLSKFWLNYEPSLSQSIADSVNSVLEFNKPTFLDDLRLTTFTLGSESPRIEAIRTYPRTDDDVLMMDWDISFSPFDEDDLSKRAMSLTNKKNSKIELVARVGKGVASVPLPIILKEVGLEGTLRVQMKFSTIFPHIKTMEFGFIQLPKVDFILRPLKGMDLMDTPGLSKFIDENIKYQLEQNVVDPNRIVIPLEEWMGASAVIDKPVGIIRCILFEGKKLKNVELTGMSDPYVKVLLGDKVVGKTKVIDNTLAPYWNETHYIIIYQSTLAQVANQSDEIHFEVYDHNANTKDKQMGLTRTLKLSKWLKLMESAKTESSTVATDVELGTGGDGDHEKPGEEIKDDVKDESREPDLTDQEKVVLATEWGLPSEPSNIWKTLYGDSSINAKQYGEIRLSLGYYPVPSEEVQKTYEAMMTDARVTSDIPTGILHITVHQCQNLATNAKSGSPFVILESHNSVEIGRTKIKKRTNAPVWDESFDLFVEDIDSTKIIFKVRDDKDIGNAPLGECAVDVKEFLCGTEANKDWFKLFETSSGRLRCTFKFTAVPLVSGNLNSNTEPDGFLKLTVVEAKGVKNVETFSKSDPYCIAKLAGRLLGRTEVIDNSLDPCWNKVFHTIVYSHKTDLLRMELLDFNEIQKDEELGSVELSFSNAIPHELISSFLKDYEDTSHVSADTASIRLSTNTLRDEILIKYQKDGLKVTNSGMTADIWSPIYIESKKKDAVPKGLLHFILDYFPVVKSKVLKPERKARSNSIQMLKETESPTYSSSPDTPNTIGTTSDKFTDAENVTDDESKVPLFNDDGMASHRATILGTFPMGIVGIKIHEARGLAAAGNFYYEVLGMEDFDAPYSSSIVKASIDPCWNEVVNIFDDEVAVGTVSIVLKIAKAGIKLPTDQIIGIWTGVGETFLNIIGKGDEWLNLSAPKASHSVTSVASLSDPGRIRVSVSYYPVIADGSSEIFPVSGTLKVEVIKCLNLEAVDSGGFSDPYVVLSIGSEKFFKSKTMKKNLNPTFNETAITKVKSKKLTNLLVEVFDYNKIQKHVSLGSVVIPINSLNHGVPMSEEYPLEKARCGSILLSLQFDEDISKKKVKSSTVKATSQPLGGLRMPSSKANEKLPKIFAPPADDESHRSLSGNSVGKVSITESVSNISPISNESAVRRSKSSMFGSIGDSLGLRSRASSASAVEPGQFSQYEGRPFIGEGSINIHALRNLKPEVPPHTDIYIKVAQHAKKKEYKTGHVKYSADPVWKNETFTFKLPTSHFTFHVKFKPLKFGGDSIHYGDVDFDLLDLLKDANGKISGLGVKKELDFDKWIPFGGSAGEIHISGRFSITINI